MSNQHHQGDNLLGICHAVGEAIGINPLYLRLMFAMGILVSAKITLIAYAVCGLAVLADKVIGYALVRFSRAAKTRTLIHG